MKDENSNKEKFCNQCGNKFIPKHPNQIHCNDCIEKGYKHICENCGEIFYDKHHVKKFCSRNCYKQFKTKKRIKTNCEYCGKKFTIREGQKEGIRFCSHECAVNFSRKKRTCKNCGKIYTVTSKNPHGWEYEFCSVECKETQKNLNKEKRSKTVYEIKECLHCHKKFKSLKSEHQKFCSQNCVNAYRKEQTKKKLTKICKQCGKTFIGKSKKQIFCSPECQHKAQRKIKEKQKIKCKYCGNEFTPDKHHQFYCSDECKETARKKRYNKKHPHVKKYCKICGKSISAHKTFCSDKCIQEYRLRQGLDIKVECTHCHKEFIKNKNSKARFCSTKCANESRRTNKCKTCGNYFSLKESGYTFFCSEICHLKYRSLRFPHTFHHICPTCGKYFKGPKNQYYCSPICERKKRKIGGALCNYKDIIVKSTYELRVCEILDRLKAANVIDKWDYEPDKIVYISDEYNKNTKNYEHTYTPDFKVYKNGFFFYIEAKGQMMKQTKFLIEMTRNKGYYIELWKKGTIEAMESFLNISKDEIQYIEDICKLLEYPTK